MDDPSIMFDDLVARVAACRTAAEQQAVVDQLVTRQPYSPLVSNDEAIIWYAGAADQVILRGDMLGEGSAPLTRLVHTRFWFHRGRYERDARLDYHLLVDGVDVGDPRNPRSVPGGYGSRGELRMPGYVDPEVWRSRPDVPQGQLDQIDGFDSTVYPGTRTVWVYTPPGYTTAQRYPSLYFHDGGDYLRFAGVQALLSNLIHDGTIPPCIAVFVDPSEHGRVADYDHNLHYVRFICDELVPWIDQRYATQPDQTWRAIIGASYGGLISLLIAHERSDVFGLVGSQSGFVSRAGGILIDRYRQSPPLRLKLDLIIGTYETEIGPFDRPSREADFLHGNREFRSVLRHRGYPHAYAEYHEGHSWGLWRVRLADMLRFLLG